MADNPTCLINPQKARTEPSLTSSALLIPLPGDLQQMTGLLSKENSLTFKNQFLRVFHDPGSQRLIGLGGPAVGAPQAVMILEKLIVLGARKIVFFGWTGGLQPNLSPGDLILVDKAFSEEGTSRHYSKQRRPRPSSALSREVEQILEEENLSYFKGPVWTTDAPYRETVEKVRSFQARGVLGVDMETSALFTVGAFRGIEIAALLIVSDDLSGMTWRHGFREPRFLQARMQTARLLYRWVSRCLCFRIERK
jgi:uridine phosphorylase